MITAPLAPGGRGQAREAGQTLARGQSELALPQGSRTLPEHSTEARRHHGVHGPTHQLFKVTASGSREPAGVMLCTCTLSLPVERLPGTGPGTGPKQSNVLLSSRWV